MIKYLGNKEDLPNNYKLVSDYLYILYEFQSYTFLFGPRKSPLNIETVEFF